MEREKIVETLRYFEDLFGAEPRSELDYSTDIDLLVAVILSAQCTDKRVNTVTKELFKKYKTVQDYAKADLKVFEKEIYSTGFYRNKAKNIISMAQAVVAGHGGKIPGDMDALTDLAGVGRKTASVFLAEFYKLPAIAVDTHVARVSKRLGFSTGKNPVQIERDLKELFDKEVWRKVNHYMVLFGRYYCTARGPRCGECKINVQCTKYKI